MIRVCCLERDVWLLVLVLLCCFKVLLLYCVIDTVAAGRQAMCVSYIAASFRAAPRGRAEVFVTEKKGRIPEQFWGLKVWWRKSHQKGGIFPTASRMPPLIHVNY